MVKRVEITPEVSAVLERGEWRGWLFVLPPGQLDRKLYEGVNKVLVALGGKWHRGHGGHMFSLDAKPAFVEALAAGGVVDQKRTLEQFFTPGDLAKRVVDAAAIEDGMTVLEPSAGAGALVDQALARGAFVWAVEISNPLALRLPSLDPVGALRVWNTDFMAWSPPADEDPIDRVVMNPPFSRNQDIAHVRRAFGFLRPGGKLVAIMSPHFTFATDRPSIEFRELIGFPGPEAFRNGENVPVEAYTSAAHAIVRLLPAGSFKAEGTNVAAVLVLIEKAR